MLLTSAGDITEPILQSAVSLNKTRLVIYLQRHKGAGVNDTRPCD